MSSIGQRIARWRKERQLTQVELESRAGLTPTSVSRIENDQRTVTTEELQGIAAALHIDVLYLLEQGPAVDPLYNAIARVRAQCSPSQRQVLSEFFYSVGKEFAPMTSGH